MADTTFVPGTVVASTWLNDVNSLTYKTNVGVTGSVTRTAASKLKDHVSLFDFFTEAQIADWKACTLVNDLTVPMQAFVDACSSNIREGTPNGFIPNGFGKITAPLIFKKTFVNITGGDMNLCGISYDANHTGQDCFQVATMNLFRPRLSNFGIAGDSASGMGFNFNGVQSQMYDNALSNLYIVSGKECIRAIRLFSFALDTIIGISYTENTFVLSGGPGLSCRNMYASRCGTGKCGYRMRGTVTLIGCNGVDTGEIWGVFGQDPSATDGFQNDFPNVTSDYPNVTMIGCNVENFTIGGVMFHNSIASVNIIGGTLQYSNVVGAIDYAVRARHSGLGAGGINVGFGRIFTNASPPNLAYLYTDSGAIFIDTDGCWATLGVSTFLDGGTGTTYPLVSQSVLKGTLGEVGYSFNEATARRLVMQMVRYATPTDLTPVGSNQTIDVTGYTKVRVVPAAGSTVNKATFTTTPGGNDGSRNGDLLIEAGNGNLTIVHSASGADTFRMAGAANVVMTTGQILRFCRSTTSSQWIQV